MTVAEITARIDQIRGQLGLRTATVTATSTNPSFATSLQSAVDGYAANGVTGSDVVEDAKKYLGVPYVFGGTNPATGLDCSGLVQRVYKDLGIDLPRLAKDQAKEGQPVAGLAQAKPGDLLAFNSPVDHIAIYIGDNKMIAAPKPGDKVKIQSVYETPTAIRRILPETQMASAYGVAGSLSSGGLSSGGLSSGGLFAGAAAVRPAALTASAGAGPVPYADLFKQAEAKHGVSANLLAAVAKVESGYNPKATSKAGAQGLMQIMPGTAKGLGVNALDPAQAVDGAARLLKANLKEFNNSLPLALAAYNAGGGAVKKYGGIPPYAETQAYVPKVQAAMAEIAKKGFV